MAAARRLTTELKLVAEQRLVVFRAQIEQFCRLWPESEFYFGQLLSYVNHPQPEEVPAIRIYQRTILSKQPTTNELNTSSGLTEVSASTAPQASTQTKS